MKKLFLTASLILGFCGLAKADRFEVPSANTDQSASVYYGGVKYASSAFSAELTTVTFSTTTAAADFGGVVYGALFSTGACGDFADVFDSTGADAVQHIQVPRFRVYNVAGSTTGAAAGGSALGGVCSGFSGLVDNTGIPVRLRNKIFFDPSSSGYNSIMLYYWKPE